MQLETSEVFARNDCLFIQGLEGWSTKTWLQGRGGVKEGHRDMDQSSDNVDHIPMV